MFINCPNCSALVATNLVTNLPPQSCPRCGFGMLAEATPAAPIPAARPSPEPGAPQDTPSTPAPLVFVPLRPSRPSAIEPAVAGPVTPPPTVGQDEGAAAPETAPDTPQTTPAAVPEALPDLGPAPDPDPAPATEAAPPTPPPEPVAAAAHPQAPGFLQRRRGFAKPGLRSIAIAGGLALLLVVQLLLADRDRQAASAGWRPVVAVLCGALRCSLPAWREPAAIAVEQRDVRPVPGRPGTLRVSATIRNDAGWPQAWPLLTLTLSDIDGRALGMRSFQPAEYLTSPPQDVTVASGESTAIQLDIVEPAPHAVAFNLQFD